MRSIWRKTGGSRAASHVWWVGKSTGGMGYGAATHGRGLGGIPVRARLGRVLHVRGPDPGELGAWVRRIPPQVDAGDPLVLPAPEPPGLTGISGQSRCPGRDISASSAMDCVEGTLLVRRAYLGRLRPSGGWVPTPPIPWRDSRIPARAPVLRDVRYLAPIYDIGRGGLPDIPAPGTSEPQRTRFPWLPLDSDPSGVPDMAPRVPNAKKARSRSSGHFTWIATIGILESFDIDSSLHWIVFWWLSDRGILGS